MRPTIVIGLALVGATGAAAFAASSRTSSPTPSISAEAWRPRAGDIVLTATRDALDAHIRGDAAHSHAGLVVEHGARLVIVEASPFGTGTVTFRDIAAFTTSADLTDVEVLRPRAPPDGRALAAEAARLVAARVPFDYDLDADDSSRLYCSELVADLLGNAGVDVRRLRRVAVSMPFGGVRQVILPDAFADDPDFISIYRYPSE